MTALLSFTPDVVAVPLLEQIKRKIEDCDPMADKEIHEITLSADERLKCALSGPLKYGRLIGASPVVNQIQFNRMNTGYLPYGMPLEGYVNPYQAYPQIREDFVIPATQQAAQAVHQVAPVVQQVNPAVITAQVQADIQAAVRVEMARQLSTVQLQLQATQSKSQSASCCTW